MIVMLLFPYCKGKLFYRFIPIKFRLSPTFPTILTDNEADEGSITEMEIAISTGTFTASNDKKTYHSVWRSTAEPHVLLSCGVNNMADASGKLHLYIASGKTCTYTISAPRGYEVAGFEFDFIKPSGKASITVTAGSTVLASTESTQHITGDGLSSFTLSGSDTNPIEVSNFKVRLKKVALENNITDVFTTQAGDVPYRIPAITRAKNDNLVAVADYRYCKSDIGGGSIDLRYRISTDNGKTWGDIKTLVNYKDYPTPTTTTDARTNETTTTTSGKSTELMHTGFGDPCIVTDCETGKMMVLSCTGNVTFQNATRNNHQGIARFYSTDNGETWEDPTEISESIYTLFDNSTSGKAESLFVGSGRIFQSHTVKVGTHYRLYCVVLLKDGRNYVLYSDDFGANWAVLGGADTAPITGGDEPKAEELPDGSVLVSSRLVGGRKYNIFRFTDTAKTEGAWGTQAVSNADNNGVSALSNGTNGEILILPAHRKADNKDVYLALQSVPFGPGRNNVGIYYKELSSFNHMKSPEALASFWTGSYQVSRLGSAYSTMSLLDTHHIGFLYEESTYGADYTIRYQDLSLETITDGQYSYTDKASTARFVDVTSTVPDVSSISADEVYCISNYNIIAKKYIGSNTQSVNTTGLLASSADVVRTSTDGANLDVLWKVLPQTDGTFLIQHIQTGAYLGKLTANAAATKLEPSVDNAGAYAIAAENTDYDKAFTLRNNSHLANAYQGDSNTSMADYSENHTNDKGSFWTFTKYDAVFTDISSLGYASYSMPFETTIATEGVKAYYASATDDDMLLLTEVPGGVIPAGEGVILTGPAEATVRMNVTHTKATLPQRNLLEGSAARRTGFSAQSMYLLSKNRQGEAAFLRSKLTAVPANKAYLPTSSLTQTNGISSYSFQFTETPTGMGTVEAENPNGNAPEEYYDLNGRRVLYPVHGIYVTGTGRKVLIK